MATDLLSTRDDNGDELTLTGMNGGRERGRCVQVTVNDAFVVLTSDKVREVRDSLTNWLADVDSRM